MILHESSVTSTNIKTKLKPFIKEMTQSFHTLGTLMQSAICNLCAHFPKFCDYILNYLDSNNQRECILGQATLGERRNNSTREI